MWLFYSSLNAYKFPDFEKVANTPYSVIEIKSDDGYSFAYYDTNGEQQQFYECDETSCSSQDQLILLTYTKRYYYIKNTIPRDNYRITDASIRVGSDVYELECDRPVCIPTKSLVPEK